MENNDKVDSPIEAAHSRFTTLAMVYSIPQIWRELYDADAGLERGTIFRELDMPLESVPQKRAGNGGTK